MQHLRAEDGFIGTETLQHHIILGGIYADTPAQRKISKWRSHAAYNGCGHCALLGKPGPTGRGMYFTGYEEERAAGESATPALCIRGRRAFPATSARVCLEQILKQGSPDAGPFWSNYDLEVEGGSMGKAFCGEAGISYSHDDQYGRALCMEEGGTEAMARELGCHGLSPAVRYLDYVDYNNLFVVPMCHALLYGVVKGFWKLLLTPPTAGDALQT